MAKRTTQDARGITPAGVFTSTYCWSYPCKPRPLWMALTTGINRWWQPAFFAQASSKTFKLEPRLGGMMGEVGPASGNAGVIWGTVMGVDPGRWLLVVGHTTPRWGGPHTGTMEFTIAAAPCGASLTLVHAVFGNATAATRRSLSEGWSALFDTALRAHLSK